MRAPGRTNRSGFTVLELIIASTLAILIVFKVATAMKGATELASSESSRMVLEDNARQVIDRISLAIMGCDRETLVPIETPFHTTTLEYRVSLGVEEGEVVWADPEEIGLSEGPDSVIWRENPDEENERRVVWTNLVSEFLEGELDNDVDDNGNGLVDESGLNFVISGNSVTIRLTLGSNEDEMTFSETIESNVAVRN